QLPVTTGLQNGWTREPLVGKQQVFFKARLAIGRLDALWAARMDFR
ncbi:MAG: hypothetical protein RL483_668, partial [Pseudomonadota bacterium]